MDARRGTWTDRSRRRRAPTRKLAAADARRARRPAPQQLRRDVGGAVPDVGLRLFERRGSRGDVQGREHPLSVFALRQSHRHDVREPARRARGRGGLPRHLDRHVGGVLRAARAAQVGRPHRRGAPALRLVPLHRERAAAEVRHPGRVRRRRRPQGSGRRRCRSRRRPCCSNRRPTRCSTSSTSRRCAISRTRPAPRSCSTTPSPRRCCSVRSNGAPTSSCTRPPSTSTARAAPWAARCWAPRSSSSTSCSRSSATPARRSARSTPGCW